MAIDKKKLWVGWTRDAMTQYDPPAVKNMKLKALIEDMTAFTTAYADAMLEEFEETFEKGRTSRDEEPEEDDEDEDEDDEDER